MSHYYSPRQKKISKLTVLSKEEKKAVMLVLRVGKESWQALDTWQEAQESWQTTLQKAK
jgi:hypothetical protein